MSTRKLIGLGMFFICLFYLFLFTESVVGQDFGAQDWRVDLQETKLEGQKMDDYFAKFANNGKKYLFFVINNHTLASIPNTESGVLDLSSFNDGVGKFDIVGRVSVDVANQKQGQSVKAGMSNDIKLKIEGVATCNIEKGGVSTAFKGTNCVVAEAFTWSEDYSSDAQKLEMKIGKNTNGVLKKKLAVDDNSGKWYAIFYSIVDPKIEKFLLLTQAKAHWVLVPGSVEGDEYDGTADLTINEKAKGGETIIPGDYSLQFKVKQDFGPTGVEFVKEETKTVFLKVTFDCMMQMEPIPPAAALDCKKTENLPECQKQCENDYCEWKNACVNKAVAGTTAAPPQVSTYEYNKSYFEGQYPVPKDWTGAMPPCAFAGTCRDVNDLVALIIRWASGFFAILGTFAFAYFIYGGFTIMLSLGNAEKVKKGQQTIVAAVVGLFIAFSAYLAIDFMLDALNVSESFRGINLSN